MDRPPCEQTPVRSPPFQARAFHFLKKLAQRGSRSTRKPKDTVTIPAQDFQRARSSVDLLRKPDLSRFIGFRVEDGPNPMDADDSSQSASPSGNSSPLRPRRYSHWDSLRTPSIHSTFAARDAAPLFFRDQVSAGSPNPVEPGNLLAPAPLFLRSSTSVHATVQPARDAGSSPEIPSQIVVTPQSKPDPEAVHDMLISDTPRPSGNILSHHDTLTNSMTDPLPSSAFGPTIPSGNQLQPFPDTSTSGKTLQGRLVLLPHHTVSLPPPFRVTTEHGLRLSPSIITRQPLPLLNLPALPPPPPVPDSPDTPSRQSARLRSMPSLCRHGRSNIKCEVDHENAMLGESDEEDSDEGDEEEFVDASCIHHGDDEDDDSPRAIPSFYGFKSSQKQPMGDDQSPSESPISPISLRSDSFSPSLADCFCSKAYAQSTHVASSSTSLEMYPFSPDTPSVEITQRHVLNPDLPIPEAQLESKPSIYRVGSRSMFNLGPSRRVERSPRSKEIVGSNQASTSGHTTQSPEESEGSDTEAAVGRLLRRTSMPSFHPTSDPPPYPTFDPSQESRTVSREDEGERLPPYDNSLYLIAIMPRKMEFSSPGVQAKDRKWRRVVCELEGTVFRVYRCPPGASGAGVLGDWWEKHVGVGDVAGPNQRTRKRGPEEQSERPAKLGIDETSTPVVPPASSAQTTSVPPARRRTGSQSSMATQSATVNTPRPAKRMSAASFLSPFRSANTTRPEPSVGESSRPESRELELLPVDTQDSRSSMSHESTGRATPVAQRSSVPPPPRSATRLSFLTVGTGRASLRSGDTPKPPKSDLLRAYTLQYAESGLGNDYLKRKNVIRVRLEGEQFLLQAPDIPAVVEWIEALHAGTNIALDIDQRPMPRGPMFPRRRRRRARRTEAENTSGQRAFGSS